MNDCRSAHDPVGAPPWLQRGRRLVGTLAIGHFVNQAQVVIFDYVLYPAVIIGAGPLWGGAFMTILSGGVCYGALILYDRLRRDWLGIELLKSLRDGTVPKTALQRATQRLLRWGDIPAFIALSIRFDPLITVLYLRRGSDRFDGLSPRDWRWFLGSVALANGYWTGLVVAGVEVARYMLVGVGDLSMSDLQARP